MEFKKKRLELLVYNCEIIVEIVKATTNENF